MYLLIQWNGRKALGTPDEANRIADWMIRCGAVNVSLRRMSASEVSDEFYTL